MTRLVRSIDRRVMRPWTRQRPRAADTLLTGLSRAAEYARLWLAIAGAFSAFGGPRGRRAAGHGVLALACTSTTVHALKLLTGRRRPAPRRPIYRRPRTSSFPSGHAASASAFAVAASREVPEAAPLLLPLAALVAYSRVYLGVHYPTDVIAGGAVGAVVGLGARRAAWRLAAHT